ncbi:hypothetical protein LTR10_009864 [Elasticomyces elasticus]|nr:hypothetical protein LTR10_009864 [Elasticomyces elasticus]
MAMVATGAYAQSQYAQTVPNPTTSSVALVTASASTSYTTVTYSDCPSLSMESMITVTNGITVTYCPECEMASSTSAQPGHTTVYTTTYLSMCPTGLVPATYTVTESCTEPTPTWTPGPDHIPQGFTVTTQHCGACETPGPVTVTQPCGCEANEGTPVPAATTPPASGGSGNTPAQTTPAPAASAPPAASASAVCELGDGQPQAGCASANPPVSGGSGSGSNPPAGSAPAGSAPAPSGGSYGAGSPPASAGSAPGTTPAPGRLPAGSNAPYPTAKTTAAACPGPQCAAHGNTTGIEQSTGGAASFGVFSSAFMALVVAVFAFTL